MVTLAKIEQIVESGIYVMELRGLSTDAKPVAYGGMDVGNGSAFFEMNTGKVFMFNGANNTWGEI